MNLFEKAINHLKKGGKIENQKWINVLIDGWEEFQNRQEEEYELGYSNGVCNIDIDAMNKKHAEIKQILIDAGFSYIAYKMCKNEKDTLDYWS